MHLNALNNGKTQGGDPELSALAKRGGHGAAAGQASAGEGTTGCYRFAFQGAGEPALRPRRWPGVLQRGETTGEPQRESDAK